MTTDDTGQPPPARREPTVGELGLCDGAPADDAMRCDGPAPSTVWPVAGPDPIDALRALPGSSPHIDIVTDRLHQLLPPTLEPGCPLCGVDDCDCQDWAERGRLEAAIRDRFAEYGYRVGGSLARLAVDAIQDAGWAPAARDAR